MAIITILRPSTRIDFQTVIVIKARPQMTYCTQQDRHRLQPRAPAQPGVVSSYIQQRTQQAHHRLCALLLTVVNTWQRNDLKSGSRNGYFLSK